MSRRFRSRSRRKRLHRPAGRLIPVWLVPTTFVLLTLTLSLYLLDMRLRPMVMTASAALAHRAGSEALHAALDQDISSADEADDLLTTRVGGSDGAFSVTSVNMAKLTELQGMATRDAQARLVELSRQTIRLPVVHMFSGSLLSGSTMTIPVRISMLGTVHSAIESDVETKGVNQVVHIIYLHVTADVMVITPFVTTPTSIETWAPVAYLVMSGPVPNAFYGNDTLSKGGRTVPIPRIKPAQK